MIVGEIYDSLVGDDLEGGAKEIIVERNIILLIIMNFIMIIKKILMN